MLCFAFLRLIDQKQKFVVLPWITIRPTEKNPESAFESALGKFFIIPIKSFIKSPKTPEIGRVSERPWEEHLKIN